MFGRCKHFLPQCKVEGQVPSVFPWNIEGSSSTRAVKILLLTKKPVHLLPTRTSPQTTTGDGLEGVNPLNRRPWRSPSSV